MVAVSRPVELMELNPQRRAALRPSELRNIQRQRQRQVTKLQCTEDSPSLAFVEEKLVTTQAITENCLGATKHACASAVGTAGTHYQQAAAKSPRQTHLDWSLKSSVTFSTKCDLPGLKTCLNHGNINKRPSSGVDEQSSPLEAISKSLFYWRFPYPAISHEQRRHISTLQSTCSSGKLRGKKEIQVREELAYFEVIRKAWRKAFASLYEDLKGREGGFFYYFQHDFGALFRNTGDAGTEAILCRCSDGTKSMLKAEGIAFEETEGIKEEPGNSEDFRDYDCEEDGEEDGVAGSEVSDEDQENCDLERIKSQINRRLRKRRHQQIARGVVKRSPVIVRDVHGFVDFVLNQRDGKSFVVIPELLAPWPFLFGSQCRNEAAVYGPDMDGVCRVRICGQVSPWCVKAVRDGLRQLQLCGPHAADIELSAEVEGRTEALCRYPYSNTDEDWCGDQKGKS